VKYPRMPEHLDRRRKLLTKDIARAMQMKAKGKTYAAIGRALGVSETAAKYWMNPEYREVVREKARIRSRTKFHQMTDDEKKEVNRQTVQTLMRKRALQPEYKEYADQTHYKYTATPKASKTRRKYYAKNAQRLNEIQRAQYQKHRAKRLAYSKIYVAEHLEEIRRKSREYYQKNKEKVLARHKERRAKN